MQRAGLHSFVTCIRGDAEFGEVGPQPGVMDSGVLHPMRAKLSRPPPPCCAEEYQAETRLVQTSTEKPLLNTRLHNPQNTRAVVQTSVENDTRGQLQCTYQKRSISLVRLCRCPSGAVHPLWKVSTTDLGRDSSSEENTENRDRLEMLRRKLRRLFPHGSLVVCSCLAGLFASRLLSSIQARIA